MPWSTIQAQVTTEIKSTYHFGLGAMKPLISWLLACMYLEELTVLILLNNNLWS